MTSRPTPQSSDGRHCGALLLRIARDEDVEALRRLLDTAWRSTYGAILDAGQLDEMARTALDPGTLRARLSAPDAIALVAESDGVILGHLAARAGPASAHVDRLYVAGESQGRGVGAALLAALQARIGAATTVTLHVEASNRRALAFYERQGFRQIGRARETAAGVAFDVRVLQRSGAP